MKKKICKLLGIGCVLFMLLYATACSSDLTEEKNISDKEWAEYEKNSKVNINKTFTGTIDEVINKYLLYELEKTNEEAEGDGEVIFPSEFTTVEHILLDKEINQDKIKCYVSYSLYGCGFINGIFTDIGGGSEIPIVIILRKVKNEKNTYNVINHINRLDGELWESSVKKMFPEDVYKKYNNKKLYEKVNRQIFENKKNYLKRIKRDTKFQYHVETTGLLSDIYDGNLSDKNLEKLENIIYDFEEKYYPTWIGTREVVKKGKRYIYKAEQEKKGENKYLLTYTKTDETGNVLEQYKVNVDKADYKVEKVI